MKENMSEVARLLQHIALQEEAAQRVFVDFASVASHESINLRMQRGAERILHLVDEGKHAEAQAILFTDPWGLGEAAQEAGDEQTHSSH